jgi:hypothetical protein
MLAPDRAALDELVETANEIGVVVRYGNPHLTTSPMHETGR